MSSLVVCDVSVLRLSFALFLINVLLETALSVTDTSDSFATLTTKSLCYQVFCMEITAKLLCFYPLQWINAKHYSSDKHKEVEEKTREKI